MEYIYRFSDGSKSVVEVSPEMYAELTAMDRAEAAQNKKEHRHCYSLDAAVYEGEDYADDEPNPDQKLLLNFEHEMLVAALLLLTEIQRRRFLMYADGMSSREIARYECVDHMKILKSIHMAQNKLAQHFSQDEDA